MNPFESGSRTCIPAVLVYAFQPQSKQMLMMHRNQRGLAQDIHAGKWNGLGGKLELDESPRQGAAREFYEESGVQIAAERMRPLGQLSFPFFKPLKNQDWWVSVFICELSAEEAGAVSAQSSEGTLSWVPVAEVLNRPLWEGDQVFLPHVLARRPFYGTFWYRDGKLNRHEFEVLTSRA